MHRLDELTAKRQNYEKLATEATTGRGRPVDFEAAMNAAINYAAAQDAVIALMLMALFPEGTMRAVR